MANADDLARGVVEQLSEDETLRGDLSDDGFNPLLEWAVNAATAYAKTLAQDVKAAEAMQNYAGRLKGVIQAVVAAADAGKIGEANELLDFQVVEATQSGQKLVALKLVADSADDNAVKIAKVLADALKSPRPSLLQRRGIGSNPKT